MWSCCSPVPAKLRPEALWSCCRWIQSLLWSGSKEESRVSVITSWNFPNELTWQFMPASGTFFTNTVSVGARLKCHTDSGVNGLLYHGGTLGGCGNFRSGFNESKATGVSSGSVLLSLTPQMLPVCHEVKKFCCMLWSRVLTHYRRSNMLRSHVLPHYRRSNMLWSHVLPHYEPKPAK